jgi:predicted secreted protein
MNLAKIYDALIEFHQNDSGERNLLNANHRLFYKSPLTLTYQNVEKEVFYGKNIGFNIRPSMRHIVKTQTVLTTCLYDLFYSDVNIVGKIFSFIYSFGKYSFNHEKRGEKAVFVSENSTVEFTKVCIATFIEVKISKL